MWGCRRLSLIAAPVVGIALLSACTQPPGTIFREKPLPNEGQLDLTDSRVRAITTQIPDISTKPGVVVPSSITCVEPPPSVALALANGLGVGISVLQYGSGALSNAVSENVFQTEERTIAIQALLNAGYQNCLDYSNGAITNTFYAIRASNLDNLLVTMALASEAAGNLRSNLGSASTQAAAEAQASQSFLANSVDDIQKSAKALGDARRVSTAARENLAQKKSELIDATEEKKKAEKARDDVIEANKTKPAAEQQDVKPLNDAVEKKTKAETDKKAEVEKAQAELNAAEQDENDLENAMLNKVEATASSEAAGKDVKGAGGPSGRPTDTAVLTIGEMQRRFLERSTTGQYITACLVELGLSSTDLSYNHKQKEQKVQSPTDLQGAQPSAGQTQPGQDQVDEATTRDTFERELWDAGVKDFMQRRLTDEENGFNENDANIFKLFARSERSSRMADLCAGVLQDRIKSEQETEGKLAMERVKNERLDRAVRLLEVRAQISQQCEAIKGKDDDDTAKLKAQCRSRVESIDQFIQRELGGG